MCVIEASFTKQRRTCCCWMGRRAGEEMTAGDPCPCVVDGGGGGSESGGGCCCTTPSSSPFCFRAIAAITCWLCGWDGIKRYDADNYLVQGGRKGREAHELSV